MKIFISILMLLWSAAGYAESASVVDNVRANLRTGKGENYRFLRVLPPKTEVEIIETSDDYTKVKTAEGQTGWVKSSLLGAPVPTPKAEAAQQAAPPPDLAALQKELQEAREELVKMQNELEMEQARAGGEPQLTTLYLAALAAFAVGVLIGALALRAYYIRRLHGLRI
jgi:uncharacterized protein YgiM (DUF1202 family)